MDKITPEMIPDEAYNAWHDAFSTYKGGRAALAAALNAWQGVCFSEHLSVRDDGEGYCLKRTGIHLPFPQKEKDDVVR